MTRVLTYEKDGIECLASLPLSEYERFGYALNFASRRDKVTGGAHGGYGIEREFHDLVTDGDTIYRVTPSLFTLYLHCHNLAQMRLASRHEVNFSPWRKSAMTMKAYTEVGDQHGWHVETNGLSVLFCLEGEARLDVMEPNHVPGDQDQGAEAGDVHVTMLPGEAWLLRGHDIYHRVPPLHDADLPRTTLVMNYYLDGNFDRPEGIDEQHYA